MNTIKLLTIAALTFLMLFTSCIKENTPAVNLNEMVDNNAVLVKTGLLISGPYGRNAMGKAEVYQKNGEFTVAFDSLFQINNGPALHVYLSKEQQPVNFIDLGELKSVNGSQLYKIDKAVDITLFKYVLVHCKQYDHLFGYAVLN